MDVLGGVSRRRSSWTSSGWAPDPRSTVGTATDVNAMLRILFSRLGDPHIGPPSAYSFNTASVRASGAITVERGNKKAVKATFQRTGGMCTNCEGRGTVSDIDLSQLYDDSKSLAENAFTIPGWKSDSQWTVQVYAQSGFVDPDKPICDYTDKELRDFLYGEPVKVKVNGVNLTYEGLHSEDPEVLPVQGQGGDAAAHQGLRGAGGHLHHLSRVRGHPAQ
ncbi:UvrABC system protein A [Streptomyces tendae]